MSTIHIKFDGDRLVGEDLAKEIFNSQVMMEDVEMIVFPQEILWVSISFSETFHKLLRDKANEWSIRTPEVSGSIKFMKKYNKMNNIPSNIYVANVDYFGQSTEIKRGELVVLSHTHKENATVIMESGRSIPIHSSTFLLTFTKEV